VQAAVSAPRLSTIFWLSVIVVAVGVGALVLSSHGRSAPRTAAASPPLVSWAAGARSAPDFSLADQHGTAISLRSLRGRPVIVTFIDPLCRNLCPLEARVLSNAVRALAPAERPAIVSVSVNPWGDTRANFEADAQHWRLDPSWRWAVGSRAQLAAVWRSYQIAVRIVTKRYAGVTVHQVAHTEAAFVIDGTGHERALFLYPFTAADVEQAVRNLA
jgi:cytochrome oxidase Cu insertion factor (SCO1/SenC/PrrC family)